jgi:hypothetical protein
MPPTQIIDDDCENGAAYYALEYTHLWRLDNPGAETRAWTEILNAAKFTEIGLGDANIQLSRVRIAGGRLYVVAVGGWGDSRDLYILRSGNAGMTWDWTFIDSAVIAIKPYTVTNGSVVTSGVQYEGYSLPIDKPTPDALPYLICEWKENGGFDSGLKYIGSWGHAMPLTSENYINQFGSGVSTNSPGVYFCWRNSILSSSINDTLREWCNEVFGTENTVHGTEGGWESANWNLGNTMFPEAGYIGFQNNVAQVQEFKYWIFWNIPEPLAPLGFDVAPTNNNWLYIGTETAILKSEDGGHTWEAIITDHGADDIKVHPTAAGAITFWATDGNLYSAVNGVLQGMLMYGSRAKVPLRITQSPSGSELYVLAASDRFYELKKRAGGSWTTLLSPITSARALRYYYKTSAGLLLFLTAADIVLSTNGGASFSYKKGGWTTYGGPVNIHLL